jgi:predicted NACHT family NTPase
VIGTTEPIPIGEIFNDVYILEKPQAYRRFDIARLQELQQDPEKLGEGKRTRGLRVVVSENAHRLYILGKPGAGKTTFMKYLVHQTIIAEELTKLPILITLRDWNPQSDIKNFSTVQIR